VGERVKLRQDRRPAVAPLFIWLIIASVTGFIAWYLFAVTVGGYKY
jgi:hypothetical protein